MKVRRYLWTSIPILTAGTLSWLAFAIIAARRHSLPLAGAAIAYLLLFAFIASPVAGTGDTLNGLGGAVLCALWGVSSFHALWLAAEKGGARRPDLRPQAAEGADDRLASVHLPQLETTDPVVRDALLTEIRFGASRFQNARADKCIDPSIWVGLENIVNDSWTLLTTARQKNVVGDQLMSVEMMYLDYVPSSIRAVTALAPEQLVTVEDAARANQSAREIVASISRELTSMMRSVGSGDLSKLDEQRAFLQSRFGQAGSIHL